MIDGPFSKFQPFTCPTAFEFPISNSWTRVGGPVSYSDMFLSLASMKSEAVGIWHHTPSNYVCSTTESQRLQGEEEAYL